MSQDNQETAQINGKVVFIDKVKLLVDKDNVIYVKKCIECGKKLTAEEASYGHDCE